MTQPFMHWPVFLQLPVYIAAAFTLLLAVKSIKDFSQTGPKIKQEILQQYYGFSCLAFIRLCLWSFVLFGWMALLGCLVYLSLVFSSSVAFSPAATVLASVSGIAVVVGFQFCRHLLQMPCSIMMSSHYNMKRLIPLWKQLGYSRVRWFGLLLSLACGVALFQAVRQLITAGNTFDLQIFLLLWIIVLLPLAWVYWPDEISRNSKTRASNTRAPGPQQGKDTKPLPNVLMIGCDTLRSDRIGHNYRRNISPFLNCLSTKGTFFTNCHTPVARTAPSLASIFTGTWPSRHGIRTNFATASNSPLTQKTLAKCFTEAGYETAAISDWSGSDLGKFDFGFEHKDLPPDQWNLKYLIRQGPKHLRLFLTLFTHNRFGKCCLPELYYLAGIPLTAHKCAAARHYFSERSKDNKPFFMNLFVGTTHPPFGTEYPYYSRYTEADYCGVSKFGMARLTDPNDIIQSQKEPKSAFDLDQIIDLYDGSVHNFDDEVRKICHQLEKCGLDKNTIVVIYSDHGMEFFENDTWGQGNNIFGNASANIPLIIYDPRREGRGEVDTLCRSIDIMPTLLELCGLEVPDSVQGKSLTPALNGEPLPSFPAYFETGLWLATPPGQHADHLKYPELIDLLEIPDKNEGTLAIKKQFNQIIEKARDRRVQHNQWLLVRLALETDAIYKLYNLSVDPNCRTDCSDTNPKKLAELKVFLDCQQVKNTSYITDS